MEKVDPLAKNFKCLKVTAVGADDTPQLPEQHAGDQLVADVMAEVAVATPPVYNEQGKPRGRPKSKPSKTSKTKTKKLGKRKGAKKTKRLARRGTRTGKKSKLADAPESTCKEPKKKSKGGKRDDQLEESPTVGSSHDKVNKRGKRNKTSAVHITPSDSSTQKKRKSRSKPVVEIEDDKPEIVNVESQESKPAKKTRKPRKTVSKHQPDHPLPRQVEDDCPEVEMTGEQVPVAEVEIPADSIPAPDHVTGHMLYSSAYRRSLKLFPGDKGKAKEAGQQASEVWRIHGMYSPALSGNPRPPRSNKPADLGGNDTSP